MAERVECDACRTHSRPCHNPARCSCWCTPHKGRACNGTPCVCFPKEKPVKVLLGVAMSAMDWRPAA